MAVPAPLRISSLFRGESSAVTAEGLAALCRCLVKKKAPWRKRGSSDAEPPPDAALFWRAALGRPVGAGLAGALPRNMYGMYNMYVAPAPATLIPRYIDARRRCGRYFGRTGCLYRLHTRLLTCYGNACLCARRRAEGIVLIRASLKQSRVVGRAALDCLLP